MQHKFKSSRLSGENHIFPLKLIIDDQLRILTLQKRKLIGYDNISLPIRHIVGVNIRKNIELIFLSEIIIITTNNQLNINGLTSSDALKIKRIIESMF